LLFASSLAEAQLTLQPIGRFQSPTAGFDQGAAEIVAYDAGTRRIFVVNAQEAAVDFLNTTPSPRSRSRSARSASGSFLDSIRRSTSRRTGT